LLQSNSHQPLSIIDALDDAALFRPWFEGPTWYPWRTILKGIYALPMSGEERAFFRSVADREPPTEPCKEVWIIAGRRAGKDSIASVLAAHAAAMFTDHSKLRPGERGVVMCLACDRDQAKIVLNYTRSYFTEIELFSGMISKETQFGFELTNGIDISVATNSFRSVRGRPVLCAILDETAFWRDESSANPDQETFNAIKPGLASLPGLLVIGISSPYRKSGLLYQKFRDNTARQTARSL
jgi:phage terminase large subunit-like protein